MSVSTSEAKSTCSAKIITLAKQQAPMTSKQSLNLLETWRRVAWRTFLSWPKNPRTCRGLSLRLQVPNNKSLHSPKCPLLQGLFQVQFIEESKCEAVQCQFKATSNVQDWIAQEQISNDHIPERPSQDCYIKSIVSCKSATKVISKQEIWHPS